MQKAVQDVRTANAAPKFSDDQDLNTTGNQADAERSVNENAKGVTVGDPVTASDADSDLLIYTMGGADAASFTIDSGLKAGDTPGQIKTAVKLDYETKSSYTVVVTATDPSGAADTVNVIISVTDVDDKTDIVLLPAVNNAPAFDADTASRSVGENMASGTNVGDPVTATDDVGDTLAYSIGESMYFAIDSATGQITTTAMLDHETMTSHSVTVTATDLEGATDTVAVTINVTDAHAGCAVDGNTGLTNDCEALLDSKGRSAGDEHLAERLDRPRAYAHRPGDWHGSHGRRRLRCG